MLENAILGYMSRHNLSTFIKTDDEVEIYEIGDLWVSVYVEGDPTKVAAIGMNEKNNLGEHLPFKKREGWHFTKLINCFYHKGDGEMYDVHFQYMYATKTIRVLVCKLENGGADEFLSTDYDRWEDIAKFLG